MTIVLVSKTYLSLFVLSLYLVVCRGAGQQMTQQAISLWFLCLGVGSLFRFFMGFYLSPGLHGWLSVSSQGLNWWLSVSSLGLHRQHFDFDDSSVLTRVPICHFCCLFCQICLCFKWILRSCHLAEISSPRYLKLLWVACLTDAF